MRPARGTRPHGWRAARTSIAAAAALLMLWMVLPGSVDAASVQQPDTPIVLRGEGSDYADLLLQSLDGAASTAKAAPRFDYIGSNEAEGLRSFVDGRAEFYVGALPLDEVQPGATAALAKKGGVISAPFQATGAVPFLSGPYGTGLRYCASGSQLDLETFDSVCPEPVVRLADARDGQPGRSLRLYQQNIVQLFTQSSPSDLWFEPSFRSQSDAPCLVDDPELCPQRIEAPGVPGPVSGVRTDNAAINKFLQEYLRAVNPTEFTNRLLSDIPDSERAGYVVNTRWPRSAQPSRSPDETLATSVRTWSNFQSSEIPKGGAIAFVHPLKARQAIELERLGGQKNPPEQVTDLWIADFVSNGEVRSGTPAAITKAIAAGGETPFYAATNSVPGAWPFSWVDRIHLPARGLSVDQTNAAALLLRLQMTLGQTKAAELGDGQLTAGMVQAGLKAANDVVASNCTAAKARIVQETGAGPYAPAGLAPVLDALGPVSWCQATASTPAPPPTTIPTPVGMTDGDLISGYVDPFAISDPFAEGFLPLPEATLDTAPVDTAPVEPAAVLDETDEVEEDDGIEEISAEMPLGLPGTDERTMDRIATVALGAALFFMCRAIWRSGMLQRLAGVAT